MNRSLKALAAIMLMIAMAFYAGCTPDEPEPTPTPDPTPDPTPSDTIVPSGLPEVMTMPALELNFDNATVSGNVVSEGISEVTERGICWSNEVDPDLNDNVIPCGSGLGEFGCTITGLEPNTSYFYRAYAKNSEGVGYGEQCGFLTPEGPIEYPNGILPGKFSISEGHQVYFSQGNLQYQASTHTWRFAEHQWDYVGGYDTNPNYHGTVEGSVNNDVSPTYNGWIDLYGWGTSGWDCGNTNYKPWNTEYGGYSYGPQGYYDLRGEYAHSDWGIYNAISNGGNQPGMWYTLSKDGWNYMLTERDTPSGMRFVKVVVEASISQNVNGLLIFPDDWDPSSCNYNFNHVNEVGAHWYSCTTVSSWTIEHILAPAGVVFLPAAGVRNGSDVLSANSTLGYWTSSHDSSNSSCAHGLYDVSNQFFSNGRDRSAGLAVRLVCTAN